jgi:glycosyltransferase involved in cell wall biosynthesis
MRLHCLSIPHTVTHPDWSHCAFTQKVRRFAPMLQPFGFHLTHYGVAGSVSGANEDVVLMAQDEHQQLLGHPYAHGSALYGNDAQDGSDLYRQWNLYARDALKERVAPGDLILLPFGHAHAAAVRGLPVLAAGAGAVESGIGYFDTLLPWRVYESFAVRHAVMAKEGRYGVTLESSRLEWVIPNYYDVTEWPAQLALEADAPVVYLGRLTEGKGLAIVLEVARARLDVPFVVAGQGDIAAFGPLPANVTYAGSLGPERAALLGRARAILAPSRYIEPFGGAVVEAALCGTPAITSDFGCFAETVQHGITGLRCQTVRQFIAAVDGVLGLSRARVAKRARKLYAMENVGRLYADAFAVAGERLAAGGYPATGW